MYITNVYSYRGIAAFACQAVELIDKEPYICVPQSTQCMNDISLGNALGRV